MNLFKLLENWNIYQLKNFNEGMDEWDRLLLLTAFLDQWFFYSAASQQLSIWVSFYSDVVYWTKGFIRSVVVLYQSKRNYKFPSHRSFINTYQLNLLRYLAYLNDYMYIKQLDVFTQPYPHFNSDLVKLTMKLRQIWVITYHTTQWIKLLICALILINLSYNWFLIIYFPT